MKSRPIARETIVQSVPDQLLIGGALSQGRSVVNSPGLLAPGAVIQVVDVSSLPERSHWFGQQEECIVRAPCLCSDGAFIQKKSRKECLSCLYVRWFSAPSMSEVRVNRRVEA